MTVDAQSAIVISRPLSEVSRYAADPDNAPLWYVNIKSVEWITPPPAQVGSRVAFVAHFLGRRLTYTYELVDPKRRRDHTNDAEKSGHPLRVLRPLPC